MKHVRNNVNETPAQTKRERKKRERECEMWKQTRAKSR